MSIRAGYDPDIPTEAERYSVDMRFLSTLRIQMEKSRERRAKIIAWLLGTIGVATVGLVFAQWVQPWITHLR